MTPFVIYIFKVKKVKFKPKSVSINGFENKSISFCVFWLDGRKWGAAYQVTAAKFPVFSDESWRGRSDTRGYLCTKSLALDMKLYLRCITVTLTEKAVNRYGSSFSLHWELRQLDDHSPIWLPLLSSRKNTSCSLLVGHIYIMLLQKRGITVLDQA